MREYLVPICEIQIWKMPKDVTTMRRRLEVYMSTWEIMRHSPIEEEVERSLWSSM
jgi:hypothetical protein